MPLRARSTSPRLLPFLTIIAPPFVLAGLALALIALTPMALAQPPDAPSTVVQPAPNPWGAPAPPPDPPLIEPEALQTRLGGPTLVTFSAQNAPLEEVLRALMAGTGIQMSRTNQGTEKQTLSVNWQAAPFWSAAAQVETLSGRVWDGRYGDGLALTRGDASGLGLHGLAATQSPLVSLVAGSISRSSNRTRILGQTQVGQTQVGQTQVGQTQVGQTQVGQTQVGQTQVGQTQTPRPDRDYVQVALTAYFDPKMSVQSTGLRALQFLVRGEDQPRVGDGNRFGYGNAVRANVPVSFLSLPLPSDTAPGTRFERITGVLHSVVVAGTEPFGVPDVLATLQMSKKAGAASHTLVSATVEGSQLTLRLSAADAAGPARNFAPYASNFFATLRVRDGAGHELPRLGTSSTGTRPEGNFRFRVKTARGEPIPGPYSLEWPFITEIRSLDVPFALRDVVVP